MEFQLTADQDMLRTAVQRWVRDNYVFEHRRRQLREHGGFDPAHWRQMAELGWLALPFAEADGGLGGSVADIAVLMEEFGRGLVVEPYLADVVLAGGLLRRLATDAQRAAFLPGLLDGSSHWALAFAEAQARYAVTDVATTAVPSGAGFRLDGQKAVVLNGDVAGHLLVTARTRGQRRDADGISLFVVPAGSAGLERLSCRTFDGFRMAEVRLAGVEVGADALVGPLHGAAPALQAVVDEATLALCAEALGVMEALQQATLEYSRTRRQFGVPIGSFQVLQHRMVDMFIHLEQARSLLWFALHAMQRDDELARTRAVSALKAYCGQAGRYIGQQAVQLHGGMGMTDELACGHYFKRLTAIDLMFGNEDFHLQRFAACA